MLSSYIDNIDTVLLDSYIINSERERERDEYFAMYSHHVLAIYIYIPVYNNMPSGFLHNN
jgi:hypothetical protein